MATIDNSLSSLGLLSSTKLAAIYGRRSARRGRSRRHGRADARGARLDHGDWRRRRFGPITLLNTAVDTWLAGTEEQHLDHRGVLNAMNTMAGSDASRSLVIAG